MAQSNKLQRCEGGMPAIIMESELDGKLVEYIPWKKIFQIRSRKFRIDEDGVHDKECPGHLLFGACDMNSCANNICIQRSADADLNELIVQTAVLFNTLELGRSHVGQICSSQQLSGSIGPLVISCRRKFESRAK